MSKKWTIIMHVSGENNLIMDSIAVFDEIGEAGGNKDVNFVILMDGMHIEGNVPAQYKYLNNKMLSYPSVYLAQGENYAEAKPYKTFEDLDNLADKNNLMLLGVGNVVAFIVALLAIKFFITFLQKYGFKLFGVYRIAVGVILLLMIFSGHMN